MLYNAELRCSTCDEIVMALEVQGRAVTVSTKIVHREVGGKVEHLIQQTEGGCYIRSIFKQRGSLDSLAEAIKAVEDSIRRAEQSAATPKEEPSK